jgi:GNAT superfamily N-acetyltransferase
MTYKVTRLAINSESTDLSIAFSNFTTPRFRCCLLGKEPYGILNAQVIALGAFQDNIPIGLVLASHHKDLNYTEVHSLFVDPNYRNNSLAHQLLKKLEEDVYSAGKHQFTFVYPSAQSWTEALEKILLDLKWNGKRPFMTQCKFNVYTFHPSWIDLKISYPKGIEEFFWKELTLKEEEELHYQEKQHIFPVALSPFQSSDLLEPLNSLGLRYQGKIRGWCLTHRVDPDTIRYSSLYIQRTFQHSKLGMKLLIDSISLHKARPTPWALIEVPLLQVDRAWVHLVEKHLVPYAETVTRLVQAWKI